MKRRRTQRRHLFALSLCALGLLTACQAPQALVDLTGQDTSAPATQETEPVAQISPQAMGYLDAAAYGDGFLAVGTQGRLDQISAGGGVTQLDSGMDGALSQVAVRQADAVAVGENGGIRLTQGEQPVVLELPVDAALHSVCFFQSRCFLGGEAGTLLSSTDLKLWNTEKLPVSGNVTGLAATQQQCMAATDRGELAVTTDGSHWTVLDYNEYYAKQVRFTGIIQDGTMFWAYGTEADGTAMVVMSTMGSVWTERVLEVYDQNQVIDGGEKPIADMAFDGQQEIAVFGTETALILPECIQCNLLETVSELPVSAVACNGETVLFAGADYHFTIKNNSDVRQRKIKADAMKDKMDAGAFVIDVRTREEFETLHISGSVNIPVDELAEVLPQFCPDQTSEIIFYCASGIRSAAALEQALEMGYENVYDFGSIDDWPGDVIAQIS